MRRKQTGTSAPTFVPVVVRPGRRHASPAAADELAEWAAERGLVRSNTSSACGHGLRERSIRGVHRDEHTAHCTPAVLGDRPTLWSEKDGRPVVIFSVLWAFRTGGGRREVEGRLRRYAQHMSLAAWLGWTGHRLDFGRDGSSPLLFCRPSDADRLPVEGRLR